MLLCLVKEQNRHRLSPTRFAATGPLPAFRGRRPIDSEAGGRYAGKQGERVDGGWEGAAEVWEGLLIPDPVCLPLRGDPSIEKFVGAAGKALSIPQLPLLDASDYM